MFVLAVVAFGFFGVVPSVRTLANATQIISTVTEVPVLVNATTEITTNVTELFTAAVVIPITTESTNVTKWTPLTEFFAKIVRNEITGVRHCKDDSKCGTGLRCDLLFKLCVPHDTPVFNVIEKDNCTLDSHCPDSYFCINRACRFCGPTTCNTNLDCCTGILNTNITYQCVDIEKLERHTLAQQLGRPIHKKHDRESKKHDHKHDHDNHDSHEEIESEELTTFPASAHGDTVFHKKRCWARCAVDNDCYHADFPEALRTNFGCCNGFCTRKESCVSLPANFVPQPTAAPTTATKVIFEKTVKKVIKN